MRDFRPFLKSKGWTLRFVWRQVGGEEAHFHRVISGKAPVTQNMAEKISAATGGFLPVGFLMGIEPFTLPVQVRTPIDPMSLKQEGSLEGIDNPAPLSLTDPQPGPSVLPGSSVPLAEAV